MTIASESLGDALDVAAALVKRRRPFSNHSALTMDDLIQDFQAFVLAAWPDYREDRARPSTFVFMLYRTWLSQTARRGMWDELPADPQPKGEDDLGPMEDLGSMVTYGKPDHEVSEAAERLMAMLPERIRPTVLTHLGYGTSLTATAEVHGVSERTVTRHAKEARAIWRQRLGLAA